MKLSDLTQQAGEWLRGSGPMSEVVISSRIRLARNVSGFNFLSKCTRSQRQTVERRVRDTILSPALAGPIGHTGQVLYVDLESAPEIDRTLLVERHLISKPHAAAEGARGVAVGGDETVSIMVNEEDHLRIQVLRVGPAAGGDLAADQRHRRRPGGQARLRLPPPLRLPDGVPDQRRHRHPRQRHAPPAGPEADRRDREGLPHRQGPEAGRPRPLRRGHRGDRRLLPDQQPDHARQGRGRDHRRLQEDRHPQDHRLRAPGPPDPAQRPHRWPWTTRSSGPWASCGAPG